MSLAVCLLNRSLCLSKPIWFAVTPLDSYSYIKVQRPTPNGARQTPALGKTGDSLDHFFPKGKKLDFRVSNKKLAGFIFSRELPPPQMALIGGETGGF